MGKNIFSDFIELIERQKISQINDINTILFIQNTYWYDDDKNPYYNHLNMIIKRIKFDSLFDESIDNIKFTDNIEKIDFGIYFNHKICYLPPRLKILKLSSSFNQSLENVVFPDSLEVLDFGRDFNQPINNLQLPPNLKILKFGEMFNQSIEHLVLPKSVVYIKFGGSFNYSLINFKINDYTELFFNRIQQIPMESLPSNLKNLTIDVLTLPLINLPIGLEKLTINYDKNLFINESKLPFSVKINTN